MAVRLFIGNLPYDVTEAELRAHFAAVGPLASLALPTDRDTGRPRGFAFVEFQRTGRRRGSYTSPPQSGIQGQTAGGERSPGSGRSCDHRSPSHRCASRTDLGGHERWRPPALRPRRGPAAPAKGAVKAQRGPKRPMYKRATGPVRFGAEDDDADEEVRGEHGASRQENAVDYDTA